MYAALKERLLSGVWSLRRKRRLDDFVRNAQARQNAIDVFKGEWISEFPPEAGVTAGNKPLFRDPRLVWMTEHMDLKGMRVLELGPMEGAHSHFLLSHGAASVVGIEANTQSYLKCLVTKELLDLRNAHFLCADFVAYLDAHPDTYDCCLASGVLYHMSEPLKLLQQICAHAEVVYLWTHYYDPEIMQKNHAHVHRFGKEQPMEYKGFQAIGYHRSYGAQIWNPLHLGGEAPYSYWLSRADILAALRYFGRGQIEIGHETPDHPAGPAFSLVARA